MAEKENNNKRSVAKPSYNRQQQKAIDDSIRAIKKYYGPDVAPEVVNSILGNIALETGDFTKLRETSYSWKNLEDFEKNPDYKSITENWKRWQENGGTKEEYAKLTPAERLSVTYWGDTEHASTAGGSGALHLTSASYGGNHKTDEQLRKTAEDLGIDYNEINDNFYNSTLATIHLYDKYRNQDFSKYKSPKELRESVINPHEDLDPKNEKHIPKINTLDLYAADPFSLGKAGARSIDPSRIVNNPNLDDGTKEELLKINESEGLEENTIAELTGSESILGTYARGYTGALDLNEMLVNQDQQSKEAKAKAAPAPQQQTAGPTNEGQQALGYMGEIGAFDPKFNLLQTQDDEANKGYNMGGKLDAQPGANVLTEYNTGGSHEQNPNGGIPVGPNSQGGQNLVEEGETRHGDYIYSNEYELSKEEAERFNISPDYIGKSYSDISREINDQMETRPHDRLVKKTAEGNLNKLMMAQETVRQQEQQELMALNAELDMFEADE